MNATRPIRKVAMRRVLNSIASDVLSFDQQQQCAEVEMCLLKQ